MLVYKKTERRIITSSDILGRLLRKIVKNVEIADTPQPSAFDPQNDAPAGG